MSLPPDGRRGAGLDAEEIACRYLEENGLEVVARNYRGRGGEIDIVARHGKTLAFVEVRSRERGDYGAPEESVGRAKMLRIAAAAREFLSRDAPCGWEQARFDVVAIEGDPDAPVIRHYPAAFDAKGKIL